MTHQPYLHFLCDRCKHEASVPTNDQPAMARGMPPAGWLTLWVDDNKVAPAHLCPVCAVLHVDFMTSA